MLKDQQSPFLRPLWRRIALVAFCVAWALFELSNGETFWATLVGAFAAYGAWVFLIAYKPPVEKEEAVEVTPSNDEAKDG